MPEMDGLDGLQINRRSMRFAHTNIVSKNWRALADFYIEVFHCKVKPPERNLSGSWLDRATGLPNARLEGVHLTLPGYDENGPALEIYSYQDMSDGESSMPNHTGWNHIGFEVDDVDRTLKNALKKGAQLLGKSSKISAPGVCELKFVYFRDPEGNVVEIQSSKKWKNRASIWSSPAKSFDRSK